MSQFIRCGSCGVEIPEKCVFAQYKRVINSREHFFCCKRCANESQKKQKEES
ncbi:MAG: transcriptional regulator [Nitrososphaeria archaeon]|nr:transcriptional regulator [Nitrososphaeria archaeon]NIN53007.1 transcriptional regulator [Nitrososphaeria archaeon]NIQ33566.1 transcriptional regulator [Nitrososphaeria archaeon]